MADRFVAPAPIEGMRHDHYLMELSSAFTDWVNSRAPFEFVLSSEVIARAAIDGDAICISASADGSHLVARVIRKADMMKVSGG